MNKEKLINKISSRIRELVPSLKKDECNYCKNRESFDDSLCPYCLNDPYMYFNIHLEHILEATENVGNGSCSIDSTGELNGLDSEGEDIYINYNLSLPLQDQSLETLESLNELLN